MWPATSSTISTRRPSSPPRSWPAERAPRHRPSCASPRRSASRVTRSCSRRRSRSTATTIAAVGSAAGPLFSFDHSELEGSLSADYANLEETARKLTTRAGRRLGRGARHRAAHRHRRRRPDGLLRQLPAPHAQPARHPRRDRRLTGGESLQRLGRIDENTLVIILSAGRAHPLLLRAMKLALHRGAAPWRSPTHRCPRSASTPR